MQNSVFPIASWCCFGVVFRTNNGTEGWHNGFKVPLRRATKLPLYRLIDLCFEETKTITLQSALVSQVSFLFFSADKNNY